MKQNIRTYALCAISIFVFVLFLPVFMWSHNAEIANFVETINVILLFLGIALFVFLGGLLYTKSIVKSSTVTVVFLSLFTNFALIERLLSTCFSRMRYWHCILIMFYLVCALTFFVKFKFSEAFLQSLLKVFSIAFSALLVLNIFIAMPSSIKKTINKIPETIQEHSISNNGQPNVYYLIFDEYSSLNFMKKYYDYDNTPFYKKLESLGFSVSYSSYNDYYYTNKVTANIFNLDYVVGRNDSHLEANKFAANNILFPIFQEKGYNVIGIGEVERYGLYPIDRQKSNASTSMTTSGDSMKTTILKNTPVYPFINFSTKHQSNQRLNILDSIKTHPVSPERPQLLIMHILLPHFPFLFDKEGELISSKNYNNWDDPKFYLEQFMYTSDCMYDTVLSIIKNDPTSIIILTSDHSARAVSKPNFDIEDACECFQAIYWSGQTIEIEGLSGINTLRVVLNTLFDMNYEMLPQSKNVS